MPRIRPSNLVDGSGWADLSGPAIKAANTRAFAPVLRDLSYDHFTAGSATDDAALKLMDNLVNFYNILYTEPVFMSQPALDRLRATCINLGESYMVLRAICRHNSRLFFRVTPKVHKIQHVPFYAEVLNPRFIQVYAEESGVGTTTTVWKASVSGRYHAHVQEVVLVKRTCGLFLRYESAE